MQYNTQGIKRFIDRNNATTILNERIIIIYFLFFWKNEDMMSDF